MAEAAQSIFNQKATEKLRSPDDLDKYVRVTNPSVWVVLAACIMLLAGLLVWGVFGTVTTGVSAMGVRSGESTVCLLPIDTAKKVNVGDSANVEGCKMKVASISPLPVSREEAKKYVESDYLRSTLLKEDWAYVVNLENNDTDDGNIPAENVPLEVTITTMRIPPLSLVFGRNT